MGCLEIPASSTNVLGMYVTVPVPVIEHLPARTFRKTVTFKVTKVRKKSQGFETTTGTLRTCQLCRGEDRSRSGVEPWPVAVWLLGGFWVPGWSWDVPLCDSHFKKLREDQRSGQEGVDTTTPPSEVQFEAHRYPISRA